MLPVSFQTLHEQVLEYRQEHLKAAEKFCACKHASKLTDVRPLHKILPVPSSCFPLSPPFSLPPLSLQKSVLSALTETCYSSQKTYQLVLSKFVISLRQAHTIDMVTVTQATRIVLKKQHTLE